PQQRVRPALAAVGILGGLVPGGLLAPVWAAGGALGEGTPGYLVQLRAQRCVTACRLGYSLVGDQVGAGAARNVVLGCGDEELARCVERVRLPAGREHALSEAQVNVPAFADAEADAHIRLRPQRALATC